jgi:hypothetical protein
MQTKSRAVTISIAIFLIISIGASMLLLSPTAAHTPPYQYKTYAKVIALPNPIGVGQSALVYAFLANPPMPNAAITNTYRRHNYTVLVTDPTGKVDTYHWDTIQDTTGSTFFRFTPTITGQYNLTFNYGGQVVNQTYYDTSSAAEVGDVYLPSTATATLTVQDEAVSSSPNSYPLPTEYWTRPIYGENQDWWAISSDWFGAGSPVISDVSSMTISQVALSGSFNQRYPGDAVGSQTSHIMWTKPLQEGGVVGGNRFEVQGDTYFEGSAYNNRYQNPIIMYGRLFYREPVSYTGTGSGDSLCVDLRTGEEIWRRSDLPTFSFGFTFDVQSPNQHGVYPAWLATSNFGQVYDMWTGKNIFNVTGNPGGTLVGGPKGEYLRYVFSNNGTSSNPNYYLSLWNSSKLFRGTGFASGTDLSPAPDTSTGNSRTTWAWVNTTTYVDNVKTVTSQNVTTVTPATTAVNATLSKRYEWLNPTTQNQSIPWRNTMTSSPTVLTVRYGDMMILRNGSYPTLNGVTQNTSGSVYLQSANWTYFAVDLNQSHTSFGQVLWWSPTYTSLQDKTITYGGADPTVRVFTEVVKETQNIIGYSYDSGQKLWETDLVNSIPQSQITPLDYFGNPAYPYVATNPAYGKLYVLAYGGVLYSYDLTTGERLWSNGNGHTPGNDTDTGLSVPGYYPSYVNGIGNGVVYTVATQHTTITPISKDQKVRAINATDGTEIWALSGYVGEFFSESFAMADGFSNWFNGYDNQIYTVGRGPSTMTVSAPSLAAASGQPVVISGTVYDISAGSKQNEQAARFPNGIPLANDMVMGDWMGYVYQQKPLPTNFLGVNVDINVVDSNGNYRTIGTATTDAKGQYNLIWTPDISGNYQVIATFAGTNGYWPSSATAAFTVMEPAATPVPTQAATASMVEQYFVPAVVGIILAIVLVGAVLLLVLRKRP